LRVAFDVPLKEENGRWQVSDTRRIRETLPTIEYLLKQNCCLVLMSWLQRPQGQRLAKFMMNPVAEKLAELIGRPVKKLNDCVGPEVRENVSAMKPGDIVMLENTRFHPEEEKADPEFAKELAENGDFIVFDAFAQAHRVHASTTGILEQKPCAAGFLFQKEMTVLSQLVKGPMDPFVIVLGGAKISDKVEMLTNLLHKASIILIGGGVANTFLKAKGFEVGASLTKSTYVDIAKAKEKDFVKLAAGLLEQVQGKPVCSELTCNVCKESFNGFTVELSKIQLPVDVLVAPEKGTEERDVENLKIVRVNNNKTLCQETEAIFDIGPRTIKVFSEILSQARTIFWNGPMGMFEDFDFSKGTEEIAKAIAQSNGFSVIGGGDTEGVVQRFKLEGKFGHVSTGGGASLAALAGVELPVLKYLKK